MEDVPSSPTKQFSATQVQGVSPRHAPISPRAPEHSDDPDDDAKLQWLGQNLMSGRPNDWVHGYSPAFSQAYRRQQAERNKPMKIDGYKSKFNNLPFH